MHWAITATQIRGTNTGFSQGSKGLSCDGNSFFFHNRTRKICTHKDVGVGMEWPFRVYTWMHSSHFFLFSLQPHKSQSTSRCHCHSMSGMPVFTVYPGLQIWPKRGLMGYRERVSHIYSRQRGTSLSMWWQQHPCCENVTTLAVETESHWELEMTRKLPGGFIGERWESWLLSTNICGSLFEHMISVSDAAENNCKKWMPCNEGISVFLLHLQFLHKLL